MEKIKNFLFKNTSTRQTIVKNTLWIGVSTTLSRVVRSAVIIYAARILGTEHYGVFTYAMSLAAIFTIFSDIGLSGLLTRELVKRDGEKTSEFASTTLVIKLVLIALATALIAIFGPEIAKFEEAKPLMLIIAILLAFDSLRGFVYGVARAENKMQTMAGLEAITEICITSLCLIMLFTNPSAMSLALGYMIGSGLGFLISAIVLGKYFRNVYRNFQRSLVYPIINSAWPFAVVGIFGVLMTNIDSVIIGIFGNQHVLGLYAAAQKPISLLYLLPGFLYTTLFPIMSKLISNDEKNKMSLLINKSLSFSLGMALPIVLGGIIIAYPLINVVFGNDFTGGVPTFQILLLTLLPIFPGMVLSNTLFAENRQKIFIKSSLAGATINVALDLFLIPIYGIVGSAIATLFAQTIVNVILFREVRKIYSINIWAGIKKMIISVFVMAVLVFILKTLMVPLIIIIPLSGIVYFGLLLLLKEQLLKDIRGSFRVV